MLKHRLNFECWPNRLGKNKRQLKDSEVVLMVYSVTKDTVALVADTAELFLFQGRVVEVRMDMLVAEQMG